jgi:hypothetical protein
MRAPNLQDGNAFGCEIPAASDHECLQRDLVADTFDQHDCTPVLDPRSLTTVARRKNLAA